MASFSFRPSGRRRSRAAPALTGLAVAVCLAHAGLALGLSPAAAEAPRGRAAAVEARLLMPAAAPSTIDPEAPAEPMARAEVAEALAPAAASVAPAPRPARDRSGASHPTAAPVALQVAAAAAPEAPPAEPEEAATEGAQELALGEAQAAPAAAEETAAPPTYATKPPPSTTLHYEIHRGMLSGEGQLRWRNDGKSYEAVLDGSVLGLSVIGWRSVGGFDAAGLAPQRFTDTRRGRATNAANFQRDKGLITYSGPSVQFSLPPGAQDRLSWMVQLAAVVNARPAPPAPGEKFTFFVTGARGDANPWIFTVQKRERISLPAGSFDTIHLLREARKAHDTRVDVWIDPARQFMPVRARMVQGDDEAFDLQLAKP